MKKKSPSTNTHNRRVAAGLCGKCSAPSVTPVCPTCKERHRDLFLQRKYGITSKEYDVILKYQNSLCAICLRPPKKHRLNVDHAHKEAFTRGLLCGWCNQAIAAFEDDIDKLLRAIEYLRNPTAIAALGEKRSAIPGRISNKASTTKALVRRLAKIS